MYIILTFARKVNISEFKHSIITLHNTRKDTDLNSLPSSVCFVCSSCLVFKVVEIEISAVAFVTFVVGFAVAFFSSVKS